jgi:two-component system OmpR family sensor kinase
LGQMAALIAILLVTRPKPLQRDTPEVARRGLHQERLEQYGLEAKLVVLSLLLVGVSAVLTARWLGGALEKLSAAARGLGEGKLATRTGLRRDDELGDVALAFDEMAARIEQLVSAQRELLANVSHELRTPLARIHVALDLAAEGHAVDGASFAAIAGDLAELERLTSDILTSARLESPSGHPPLRVERITVNDWLGDVAARFRAARPARTLRLADGSGPAELDVDPMLLRRALDNLLDNAVKYSTGEVALTATVENGSLHLEVKDSGIGIAASDLKSLFTPFFRADRSRTRQTGGLGLGLLLARRIVEAHQGELKIESAEGKGTIARIRLPLA